IHGSLSPIDCETSPRDGFPPSFGGLHDTLCPDRQVAYERKGGMFEVVMRGRQRHRYVPCGTIGQRPSRVAREALVDLAAAPGYAPVQHAATTRTFKRGPIIRYRLGSATARTFPDEVLE